MLLNCDLGESYGERRIGCDAAVMPHLDQANIACGFHGGDPLTMYETIALARSHGVAIGAHPSYPDLEGFGRRSMDMSPAALVAALHYQVSALEGMARAQGAGLTHVKPHGALYHDMMTRGEVRAAILEAVAGYHRPLALVMQATPDPDRYEEEARAAGVCLQFEAFADRGYASDGTLLPRGSPGALLDREQMLERVRELHAGHTVTTAGGDRLALRVDTLCVHGDNPAAVAAIEAVRAVLSGGGPTGG